MRHDLMAANMALHGRKWALNLVRTMRALGMTDDEIRAALTEAQTPEPTATPAQTNTPAGAPAAQAEAGLELPTGEARAFGAGQDVAS